MRLDELVALHETVLHTKTHTSEGTIHRLTLPGGYLDYDVEDGAFILMMVEVNEDVRNKKVATSLLKEFFRIVDKAEGFVTTTGFLDDGEEYLKHVIQRLKPDYPHIVWDDNAFE